MAKRTGSSSPGKDKGGRQKRSGEPPSAIKGAQGWRAINNPTEGGATTKARRQATTTRPRAPKTGTKGPPTKPPRGQPKPPAAPPTRDTAVINWFLNWPRYAKQMFFAGLTLFGVSLMTVGLVIQDQPTNPLAILGRAVFGLFGWSAYLLALGLAALALAHLAEAYARREVVRLGLVIECIALGCLLTLESRLIVGGGTGALFAELLIQPIKGFPPGTQHALVISGLLVVLALLFRVSPRQMLAALRWFFGGLGRTVRGVGGAIAWGAGQLATWQEQRAANRAARAAAAQDEDSEEPDAHRTFSYEDEADHPTSVSPSTSGRLRRGWSGATGPEEAAPANERLLTTSDVGGFAARGSPSTAAGERENRTVSGRTRGLSGAIPPLPPLPPNPARRTGRIGALPTISAPLPHYELPAVTLLNPVAEQRLARQDELIDDLACRVEHTLRSFRIEAEVRRSDISLGPTVIRIGIRPIETLKKDYRGKVVLDDAGEPLIARARVSRILALQNDLMLDLEARTIRVEAPVPGRPYIGVEIPNKNSRLVTLREILASKDYEESRQKSKLTLALGRDVTGRPRIGDLALFPHLLIAGATSAGKSVCLSSIIACLLMQATPEEVRFLMIDPKMVELIAFNGIPHLLAPVVTETEKVVGTLKRGIIEMDRRYRLFSSLGVRNLDAYRKLRVQRPELEGLPNIVIVIDELADLMMSASDEAEFLICRLAQMARATGIHLVVATQRPSVDVVTGLIKANFPTRISFMVSSAVDSRTILDSGGAERLLGRGDMLYLPAEIGKPERIQGTFLADDELERIVAHWQQIRRLPLTPEQSWESVDEGAGERLPEDDLLEQAKQVVREAGKASIALLTRRLSVGYGRAGRLMDLLEARGVVGPADPSGKGREVLPPGQNGQRGINLAHPAGGPSPTLPPLPTRGAPNTPPEPGMAGRRSDTMLPGSVGGQSAAESLLIRNVTLPPTDPAASEYFSEIPGIRNSGISDARRGLKDEDEGIEKGRW